MTNDQRRCCCDGVSVALPIQIDHSHLTNDVDADMVSPCEPLVAFSSLSPQLLCPPLLRFTNHDYLLLSHLNSCLSWANSLISCIGLLSLLSDLSWWVAGTIFLFSWQWNNL
ncbi:uncharacterized protein LOC107867751 [Capsicum annuum]|uniref:uncharacterized protein LOC107867751 n=1 Tax=Capsicum annuum TaxID=4072 RepID=UPI0007BF7BB8|nr:uncharacterized protein LOC107867751 [Capsicum annuum]